MADERINQWLDPIYNLYNVIAEETDHSAIYDKKEFFLKNKDNKEENPEFRILIEQDWITLGIIYNNPKQIMRLRNFLNIQNNPLLTEFNNALSSLDSSFKTKLIKQSKNPNNIKYTEYRSYITNRLDTFLIKRLIIEAEGIKQEIFKNKSNNFEKPLIVLTQVSIEKDPIQYYDLLHKMSVLYEFVSNLRLKLAVSVPKKNLLKESQAVYMNLVKMLNEAQKRKLITPEKRRNLEKKWRENEAFRVEVVEELEQILKN
ncbi:hypothetical protein JW865_01315 [Candidatus Bathyarchaeota archaeon]|nr:hypothetical protein [Candidatus Bathyarchaeota archaeon]